MRTVCDIKISDFDESKPEVEMMLMKFFNSPAPFTNFVWIYLRKI